MSGPASPLRIGVFGGTFDPPHRGHVSAASDVADALDLDQVLWIPAGDPPHKQDADPAPASLRLRMVRAATADDPRFRVSDLEMRREGPSYTVDTLRTLAEALRDESSSQVRDESPSDVELFLIMGIDQYRSFESWHRPDEIRELATLVVMDRGGEGADAPVVAGGAGSSDDDVVDRADDEDVVRVPVGRVDVSSTEVRAAAGRGEPVEELVPSAVARIIEAEGLYRAES